VHAVPHAPQLAAEVFRSTHAPAQAVMPVVHIGMSIGGGLLQATRATDSASGSLMGSSDPAPIARALRARKPRTRRSVCDDVGAGNDNGAVQLIAVLNFQP
jgi:hypothetical protein